MPSSVSAHALAGLVATAAGAAILTRGVAGGRGVGRRARGSGRSGRRAVAAGVVLLTVGLVGVSGIGPSWRHLLDRSLRAVGLHRGGEPGDDAAVTAPWHGTGLPPGVVGALPVGRPVPGQDVQVLAFTVHGRSSGLVGEVNVVLPPDYDSGPGGRRFPVIEAFAGFPGDQLSWIAPHSMSLGTYLAGAVSSHRLRQALIISPQVEFPKSRDGECTNGRPGDPQVETWLTEDLPAWVDQQFRVEADRAHWAAIGLSMGGFCASMAVLRHPDRYATAIVFGGYFFVDYGDDYRPWRRTDPQWKYYDLVALVRHAALPPTRMWVETSPVDTLSYPSTMQFIAQARGALRVTPVVLRGVPHDWRVWRQMLPQCLDWLGSQTPAFTPDTSGT